MLDQKRRAEIERLLRLRGRLLAPRQEVIGRALRRCVKHAASAEGDGFVEPSAELAAAPTDLLTPSSTGALPTEDLANSPEPSQSEELRIATGVAMAITVSEADADDDLDLQSVNGDTSGLIPTVIRRGSKTIKGLASGSVIKGYRIENLLGVGGMGQVYCALQMSMNRRVAFKILSPRLAKNKDFRERFLREARNAGRLTHPNLIAVHDVDESDGLIFFSMELIEGRTVKQLIAEHGRLPEEQAIRIIRGCLEGLNYAHGKGLIHRDIKPDNIMVSVNGQVKIADLGLSRVDEGHVEDAAVTSSGVLMGTPHYMAPEQSRDAHAVDARADLYATGASLYHMVCGSVPFVGNSSMDVLVRAATQPLAFPDRCPGPGLRRFIAVLMEKDPADRPSSAAEALTLLEHDLGQISTNGDDLDAHQMRRLTTKRGRWAWLISGLVVLFLAVVIAVVIQRGDQTRQWQLHQEEVQRSLQQDRFYHAVQVLDGYKPQASRAQQEQIADLRAEVVAEWDQYVQETFAAFIARLDDLVWNQRYAEAEAEIGRFASDPAKMSPWMVQHLDQVRAQIRPEK